MSSENPFAAPTASAVMEGARADPGSIDWFPVGKKKLVIMIVVTFGIYGVYWFERQYRFQRRANGEDIWPLARAIFSVLYAHDLFRRVVDYHEGSRLGLIYVVCSVVRYAIDRGTASLEGGVANGVAMIASLALMLGIIYPLGEVQDVINAGLKGSGVDPNERLTLWNWLLIVIGAPMLVLGTVGSFMM